MAQQTKADRSAAAKKAAATRKRNQQRAKSSTTGSKAASTRQGRSSQDALGSANPFRSAATSPDRCPVEVAAVSGNQRQWRPWRSVRDDFGAGAGAPRRRRGSPPEAASGASPGSSR